MNWTLLKNSLLVSGLSTVASVSIGFIAALFVCCLGDRWRRWLIGAAAFALDLPPFLVSGCWMYLLGLNGAWRSWLPVNLFSLAGTVWILSLILWPISF